MPIYKYVVDVELATRQVNIEINSNEELTFVDVISRVLSRVSETNKIDSMYVEINSISEYRLREVWKNV